MSTVKAQGSVSCFFCQNLLSDWIDGILPSQRHEEVKKHLDSCPSCQHISEDLMTTTEMCRGMSKPSLGHELSLRIMEASQASSRIFVSRTFVSRLVMATLVPALVLGALSYAFPHFFPWLARIRPTQSEAQFTRYFPLLQGAAEVVEEQANWLHVKDPFVRSVWEEGGLSPEEFEKAFQGKPTSDKNTLPSSEDAN